VVSFAAADVAAPVLTTATLDDPGAGDITLAGTTFLSVDPDITTVFITGDGAVTLTAAQILAETGGVVTATSIVIPAALVAGVSTVTSFVQVQANEQLTAVVAVG